MSTQVIVIWEMLKGKKTFIVAAVVAIFNLLVAFGLISPDHLNAINAIMVAFGLGALRSAIIQ